MISPLGESIERHLRMAEEEGIEKGMEKGIEEGAKEKAVEVAKKLLQMGMPTDEVAEITELNKDDIMKLAEQK
ncbi:hypothetical protein P5G51_006065 [Virgibacillus sp. 179-BFC.A HS]|uniref:Transposase n=1 Tax=Tigheibacillus jepli TaxID=3035914 RepID=A0ABU5CFB5_9BACI|nr:hypothetical protein [Virgibacillus sp. 179-BFC.A HS]MDY0405022.1 hypothetical protein [Virgibacillus sp. 179-BFC.A HS]